MPNRNPPVSVREWLTKNISKFQDKGKCCQACSNALGVSVERARKIYSEIRRSMTATKGSVMEETAKPVGLSVSKFVQKFDFESRLRETIEKLCKGQFVSDIEIRTACGIPASVYRRVTELPEFADWQIKDGGKIWWSMPDNVKKVREKQKQWGLVAL